MKHPLDKWIEKAPTHRVESETPRELKRSFEGRVCRKKHTKRQAVVAEVKRGSVIVEFPSGKRHGVSGDTFLNHWEVL